MTEKGGPPDEKGLRDYRLALAGAAFRWRQPGAGEISPGGASRRVEIDLRMTAAGTSHLALSRASGDAAFDREALITMQRAVEQATVPDTLRGRAFGLTLVLERGEIEP